MGNRTESWLWGPQQVLEPVGASLSFLICKSGGLDLIQQDCKLKGFLFLFCCNPPTWKTTGCWEKGGQPRFQGARFQEPGDWEPPSVSSLSAGQCSFTLLLAVVLLPIQPFNQCLQTSFSSVPASFFPCGLAIRSSEGRIGLERTPKTDWGHPLGFRPLECFRCMTREEFRTMSVDF